MSLSSASLAGRVGIAEGCNNNNSFVDFKDYLKAQNRRNVRQIVCLLC